MQVCFEAVTDSQQAQFVAVFSHNLLNDLARISGLVYLLVAEQPDGAPADYGRRLAALQGRCEEMVTLLQLAMRGLLPDEA